MVVDGAIECLPESRGIHGPASVKNTIRKLHEEAEKVLFFVLSAIGRKETARHARQFLGENPPDI